MWKICTLSGQRNEIKRGETGGIKMLVCYFMAII
jgi:hypothetical protein